MADDDVFRVYATVALDGYPPEWHDKVKHLVRRQAGYRCQRCRHPYRGGVGEWSMCDSLCDHGGERRFLIDGGWITNYGRGTWKPINATRVEARWRILTVHHLNGDKADCRWWNLAALCQRCHLTIQGKVSLDREFVLEHSDWFKPHAAGWYAWKYEGRNITREEALRREAELLAYEQRVERIT